MVVSTMMKDKHWVNYKTTECDSFFLAHLLYVFVFGHWIITQSISDRNKIIIFYI